MDSLFLRRPPRSSFQPELQPSALSGIEGQPLLRKHLWLWALLGLTAVRFLMAWIIPLSPEEAYHWNFARHLDWSYYDHPPMLGWAIALGRLFFGYVIFSKHERRWLATPWPYLGGLIAIGVFMPVIYWNWTHDWASFRFQSTARFAAANDFKWRSGLVFLGEQWLAILPLTLPL